jgi:5-formyltetrahydrofolate cyclo-ligase
VWIVPGLAFTKDGRRLGYGGGWYDRLLASARKDALRIGVAHEFQVLGDLPNEPHDILLNRVVTDAKPV